MYIQSYKCDNYNFESEDMNKTEKHITDIHNEIEKECCVESGMIAVEICYICNTVFYSKEDLDNHTKLEIQCSICKVCMAVGSSDFDYCASMEHSKKFTPRGFFRKPLRN